MKNLNIKIPIEKKYFLLIFEIQQNQLYLKNKIIDINIYNIDGY